MMSDMRVTSVSARPAHHCRKRDITLVRTIVREHDEEFKRGRGDGRATAAGKLDK